MRIVVVGDLLTDVLAVHSTPIAAGTDTAARIELTGGGSAANTAAWLAELGVPVTLVGVVGTDAAGTARLGELRAAGVTCAVRRTRAAPTGTVVVLSQAGERSMLTDRGASAELSTMDIDAALAGAADARHLHLSGYVLLDERSRPAGRYALSTAAERGLTTSVDAASAGPLRQVGGPAFLTWVRGIDLLLANSDEAAVLPPLGSFRGIPHVVTKRGAQGAEWSTRGEPPVAVPADPAVVVDVTGAGDAFAAGLLSAWCAGATPLAALRAGAHLGARAVASPGARPVPGADLLVGVDDPGRGG
jgi:ribokinase